MNYKFKVRDKVRIIKSEDLVSEENGGKGFVGEIIVCQKDFAGGFNFYTVKSESFIRSTTWCFKEDFLELVSEEKQIDPSQWNCKCKKCGSPAYQGLMKIQCSNGACS